MSIMKRIIISYELVTNFYRNDLTSDNEEQPKTTTKRFTIAGTKFHCEKYTSKVMRGCFHRTIEKDGKIDHNNRK